MLSECLEKATFSGQETREKRPETEMGNNCIFPNYADSKPQFLLSIPFPRTAQCHGNSIGRVGRVVFQRKRKRRGGFPPSPCRQTCGVAAELSRGHTTHIAFPSIHPPAPPPSLPLSAPLTRQFLSCLPLAKAVINLFLPVWLAESMGRPCSRCWHCCNGRACSRLTPTPASRHLCSSACSMLMKSSRVAAATEKISTGSVKPIHGKM